MFKPPPLPLLPSPTLPIQHKMCYNNASSLLVEEIDDYIISNIFFSVMEGKRRAWVAPANIQVPKIHQIHFSNLHIYDTKQNQRKVLRYTRQSLSIIGLYVEGNTEIWTKTLFGEGFTASMNIVLDELNVTLSFIWFSISVSSCNCFSQIGQMCLLGSQKEVRIRVI